MVRHFLSAEVPEEMYGTQSQGRGASLGRKHRRTPISTYELPPHAALGKMGFVRRERGAGAQRSCERFGSQCSDDASGRSADDIIAAVFMAVTPSAAWRHRHSIRECAGKEESVGKICIRSHRRRRNQRAAPKKVAKIKERVASDSATHTPQELIMQVQSADVAVSSKAAQAIVLRSSETTPMLLQALQEGNTTLAEISGGPSHEDWNR